MGALSLLRREGLSIRFAVESLLIIALIGGLGFVTGFVLHPVLFLILLYLVTMRVRLMVDLGNSFASRGRLEVPTACTGWRSGSDRTPPARSAFPSTRDCALAERELDKAIQAFQEILAARGKSSLGIKTRPPASTT